MKRTWTGILIGAGILACSDTTPPANFANVQVSFASQRPAALNARVGSPLFAVDDTLVSGSDTLILTSVELVLREIELKRTESDNCDSDACEKFATGPVLVDLPVGPGAVQQFALDIPPGSYEEVEFDLHKPDDGDPDDQAFVAANPDFERISIRVRGTFNGQAVEFTSDLNVEQELELVPALTVVEGVATNITILIDVGSWFRTAAGGLIDPQTANKDEPNEGIVKENIKRSMEAYEDEDRDGEHED